MNRHLSLLVVSALLFAAAPELFAQKVWKTFKGCQLVANMSNDGDSFHVRAEGKEYLFRLYFVDTPETDTGLLERVTEQARYFGITVPQNTLVGKTAALFTRAKLSRPFMVRTCLQDALGRSKMQRFYAFVSTESGDLSEELVSNGLARVHGASGNPPGMNNPQVEWNKLRRLEAQAKQEKIGGWGVSLGRQNTRPMKSEPLSSGASFDAFFHPEKVAAQQAAEAQPEVSPENGPRSSTKKTPPTARLDVNAASASELENLPQIGPAMAARIIGARPFTSADDLVNVSGIGPKKYALLRPFFQ